MKAAPVFEAGNHRWWVLHDQEERRVIDSNVYIVSRRTGRACCWIRAAIEIFPQVLAALAEVIQPSSVAQALLSLIRIRTSPPVCRCGTRATAKFNGMYSILREGLSGITARWKQSSTASRRRRSHFLRGPRNSQFIPAHYLHAFSQFPCLRYGSKDSPPATWEPLCYRRDTASGWRGGRRNSGSL